MVIGQRLHGTKLVMVGYFNAYLEGSTREKDVTEALTEGVLEYMAAQFLPYQQTWAQYIITCNMVHMVQ